MDIRYTSGYPAVVTHGTGSTGNIVPTAKFSGITPAAGMESIAFGLPDGGTTKSGTVGIDNLTIGASAVPQPASWAMIILGLGAVGGMTRRRRRTTVDFA